MRRALSAAAGSLIALAASPALAADLPAAAKTVEYVKVCSAFGAGFFYVPGTDTCLRVGGYVRFDTYVNATGTFNPAISSAAVAAYGGPAGVGIRGFPFQTSNHPDYLARTRAVLDLDARTATDYGTLRSFVRFGGQWDSQTAAGSPAGGLLYFERAFIQFAGFTAGYTQSFFDTGVNYMLTTPLAGSDTWTSVIAYTSQFGNGVSATLAVEDPQNRITGIQGAAPVVTPAGIGYANYQDGHHAPDVVGNLRLDQSWGTAQLSAALHQVAAMTPVPPSAYVGASDTASWGWALGASVEIKLPALGLGDSLFLQANYADGAVNYLGLSGNQQGRATGLGAIDIGSLASNLGGAYYPLADAVWTGSGFASETGWALQGQLRHYWLATLRSAVYGGYVAVDVPANTVNAASLRLWQAGLNTIWSPVRNLDLGLEAVYSRVEGQPLTFVGGTASALPTQILGGATNVWSGGFRAQRNF